MYSSSIPSPSSASPPRPVAPHLIRSRFSSAASSTVRIQQHVQVRSKGRRWTPQAPIRTSSDNQAAVTAPEAQLSSSPSSEASAADDDNDHSRESSSDVVRKFYAGINARNLSFVEDLIAQDCVYEDLVFPRPFVGRKAILEFFKKFIDSVGTDLQFVIDDISNEDSSAIGVTWHLEWRGKSFPFSKGCSFYRLGISKGKRQIIYGRDSVEPFIKPGDTALVAIKGVTWLLQQFPQLADQL